MSAPAGWTTINAGAYYRVWKRSTTGIIQFEEHPVQATAEQYAQNYENDKARKQ